MKFLILGVSFLISSSLALAAQVDPRLSAFARQNSQQKIRVIALMKNGGSLGLTSPQRYNFRSVYSYLTTQAKNSWNRVKLGVDKALPGGSSDIQMRNVFWINNSLVADVTSAGLKRLSQIPDIEKIYANGRITYLKPRTVRPARSARGLRGEAYPYDLVDIGIDQLMAAKPDLQGQGVFVGLIDTGVDGKHPALAGKIPLFYDAEKNQITDPFDAGSHGTHTAGTIVGGDRQSINIGVAPKAKLMASAALSSYEAMLRAMEFLMDPDRNPNTNDRPRLISNSWNCQDAPDLELFYRAISAWEAAGILPVFSAGNSGPNPQTITKPHEHPSVLAVAATGPGGKIADFSSRGPAIFHGQRVEKPDFSAPGVDIVSSVPGGGLQAMSGTSMACPHAAGAAALLFQANPQLNPAQVREVLMKTLTFVKEDGSPSTTPVWNAAYGFGRLNAFAAVKAVLGLQGLRRASLERQIHPLNAVGSFFEDSQSVFLHQVEQMQSPQVSDLAGSFQTDERRWVDSSRL